MYILKFVIGDIAWIARNLQNMEDSIFSPKPARHINLDTSDYDVVDTNDNTPSIIKTLDVETVKLSRKNNCNKLNRYDLIKLLIYITLKSPSDLRSQPLQGVNDNATDKLVKSYVSITNDNGKAPAIYSSSMPIHSKMSLHAFGSGSTRFSRIWRNNILKIRSRINSNILAITPDSSLINGTNFIGISQAGIAGNVFVSINNTISIDPSHGAKPNEPSWTLLQIPPTMTQTMHLWKFRKKTGFSILYMCN
jgi:hypothetical protein